MRFYELGHAPGFSFPSRAPKPVVFLRSSQAFGSGFDFGCGFVGLAVERED